MDMFDRMRGFDISRLLGLIKNLFFSPTLQRDSCDDNYVKN